MKKFFIPTVISQSFHSLLETRSRPEYGRTCFSCCQKFFLPSWFIQLHFPQLSSTRTECRSSASNLTTDILPDISFTAGWVFSIENRSDPPDRTSYQENPVRRCRRLGIFSVLLAAKARHFEDRSQQITGRAHDGSQL